MPQTADSRLAQPRKRRRLSLSLRALMLLVLVVAVPLAWVVTQARTQREAVAELKRMGGFVQYEYTYSGGKAIPSGQPRGHGQRISNTL